MSSTYAARTRAWHRYCAMPSDTTQTAYLAATAAWQAAGRPGDEDEDKAAAPVAKPQQVRMEL